MRGNLYPSDLSRGMREAMREAIAREECVGEETKRSHALL